jgi:pyoverdine/dityrosine biosynthesis protein Dit1
MAVTTSDRYGYVSFSRPQLSLELERLIESARGWRPIAGRTIESFDFAGWIEEARARFDFGPPGSARPGDTWSAAAAVLDILLLDRYRRGPAEHVLASRQDFVARIAAFIQSGRPIEIVIPSFPGRPVNPLTHLRSQPDLGEAASFTRLWQMSEHVRTVHEPGLRFVISLDGRAYAPFYGYTAQLFEPYAGELRRLVDELGVGEAVQLVDLRSLVDERQEEFDALHATVAEELREDWARPDYAFRDELVDSMKLGTNTAAVHAAAIKLVKYYREGEDVAAAVQEMRRAVHEQAYGTAFAYMCFLVTIRRLDLLGRRFPGALRGTVHPKEGQYSPYLVNDSTKIVPWHGVAVRRPDGRVDSVYESEVLERPDRYTAVYIRGEHTPFYYEEAR